jgi:hypothetical protein
MTFGNEGLRDEGRMGATAGRKKMKEDGMEEGKKGRDRRRKKKAGIDGRDGRTKRMEKKK